MIALIAAAVFVVAGIGVSLLESWIAPKLAPAQTPSATPPTTGNTPPATPQPPTQGSSDRTQDEPPPDIWERFGFYDDTPNHWLGVCSGSKGNGKYLYRIDTDVATDFDHFLWKGVQPFLVPIIKMIERAKGKRCFGLPLITSLIEMEFDRVVMNDAQTSNPKVALIQRIKATGKVKKRRLRKKLYRPTYHSGADTSKTVTFNLNSYSWIEVFDPDPTFIAYRDSLLQTIDEQTGVFISSQILPKSWDDYKANSGNIRRFDTEPLNVLLAEIGCRSTTFTVSDPELDVSPDLAAALEAEVIATEQAKAAERKAEGQKKATIIDSEGLATARRNKAKAESDATVTESEGQAKAIKRLTKAKADRIQQLYNTYRGMGLSDSDAIGRANEILIAEMNSTAIGNLTNYMVGTPGGVQLSVPTSGDKKK